MQNADCGMGEHADAEPSDVLCIQIANEQSSLAIDKTQLQAAVRSVLEESPYQTALISVAVVDDPTIHQLNRQYLQHDYPTDILSFSLDASETHLEGELVASADTALHNAAEYGWPALDELRLYLIHGALHLVGYRDQSAEESATMVAAEQRHLKKLGIALPRDSSRWHPEATQGKAPAS